AAVGGPVTITATLGGVSGTAQLTVNPFATSVALTSDVNPSQFGQSVTFTAAVSTVPPGGDVPTGSVTFNDGGNTLATVPLVNGVATFSTSALSVGIHSSTAEYGGDVRSEERRVGKECRA